MPMVDGPLKFLQCIGENAYKFKLPRDYDVSATFNVSIIHHPMKKKQAKTWGRVFFNWPGERTSVFQPGELDTEVSHDQVNTLQK